MSFQFWSRQTANSCTHQILLDIRYFRRKQIEGRRKASSGFSLPQLCLTQLGLRQSYKHPRSNLAPHRTGHQARLSSRIKETGEEECFIYKINWWCLFSDEPSRSRKGLIRVQNQKPWYCSWPCLSLRGSPSPSCQLCRVPGSLNNGHGLDAACIQAWSRCSWNISATPNSWSSRGDPFDHQDGDGCVRCSGLYQEGLYYFNKSKFSLCWSRKIT